MNPAEPVDYPDRLALPSGRATHLEEVRRRLRLWGGRVRNGLDEEAWVRAEQEELEAATDPETAALYQQAGPLWQSYAGLRRYWDKKAEAVA